jgi:hypothetical protein
VRLLDLFCGRWGWSRAFAARGWECIGVDLTPPDEVPAGCTFIRGDVLSLFHCSLGQIKWYPHPQGKISEQLGRFDFICASSPCEQFSVHGMKHFHPNPPYPELGIKLFNHTRSLCEASGVPYVMENVRPAQNFIGQAQDHAGSFYLWGSAVPSLLPQGLTKAKWTMNMRGRPKGNSTAACWLPRKRRAALLATIPPELANCIADYAERLLEAIP